MIELSTKVGGITIKISSEAEPFEKLSDAIHEMIELEKALLTEEESTNEFKPITKMKKI